MESFESGRHRVFDKMRSPQAGGPPNSMSMTRDYRQQYNDDPRHRESNDKEYVQSDSDPDQAVIYQVENFEKLNSFDLRNSDPSPNVDLEETPETENYNIHDIHEIRDGNKLLSFRSEKSEKSEKLKIEFPYFTDEENNQDFSDYDDGKRL